MKNILSALLILAIAICTGTFAFADTDDQSPDIEQADESRETLAGLEDLIDILQRMSGADDQRPEKPAATEAPTTIISSGDYDYAINGNTAAIAKYNGDDDAITIPSEINEYQVTEIAAEAFRYRKMKSVSIPGSIRVIGKQAFEYCEITDSLQLPRGVTIMDDAFSYAKLPAAVVIPADATVEKCAFSYCEEMERLCIDPNVVLKGRAFDYCDDLKLVVCAEGCRLEARAFECCRHMEQAMLCGDVETAEDSFAACGDAEIIEGADYDALKQSALEGTLVGREDPVPQEIMLNIIDSPATLDGVTATLDSAKADRNPETGGFTYTLNGTLENNSEEGVMQVVYTIALIDENGEEFRSFALVYDGEDTAMAPREKIDISRDDIKWGKQSVPAAVKIGISSVKTEAELPPVHVPTAGEFLYQALGNEKLANIKEEPPVELAFHVDQGGYGRTATFTEGEALDRALQLFCAIQIQGESGEWVTDNYNWIGLTWQDGSYTGISLNLNNLEYSVHSTLHTYALENLEGFWRYCADYLEED